jgi:hypothetical protein
MDIYKVYKGVKQHLSTIAPVFYYIGQYTKGKDNTTYKVPAIYIEMPKYLPITFFGKIKTARSAPIKIHLITNAPYKSHDNTIQDNALAEHNNMLNGIDKLMTGWALRDEQGKLLTQQFIPTNNNSINFQGLTVFSVVTYNADLFSYSLS